MQWENRKTEWERHKWWTKWHCDRQSEHCLELEGQVWYETATLEVYTSGDLFFSGWTTKNVRGLCLTISTKYSSIDNTSLTFKIKNKLDGCLFIYKLVSSVSDPLPGKVDPVPT